MGDQMRKIFFIKIDLNSHVDKDNRELFTEFIEATSIE